MLSNIIYHLIYLYILIYHLYLQPIIVTFLSFDCYSKFLWLRSYNMTFRYLNIQSQHSVIIRFNIYKIESQRKHNTIPKKPRDTRCTKHKKFVSILYESKENKRDCCYMAFSSENWGKTLFWANRMQWILLKYHLTDIYFQVNIK